MTADELAASGPDAYWARVEDSLEHPITAWLNLAHEACDRWARDRSRLGMVLIDADGTRWHWTFADLEYVSRRLASSFSAAGIGRGDRVAGVLTRQIEAYLAALAAWRLGAIYAPLFVGFGPEALHTRLAQAEPALVVVDHRYRETLGRAVEMLSIEPRVMSVDPHGRPASGGDDLGFWREVERNSPMAGIEHTRASDPASIMFTSGTTGAPKGCVQPHSICLTIEPFVHYVLGLGVSDMLFSGADPGWTYGLYGTGFGVMAQGFPRIVYTGRFTPEAWVDIVRQERVTCLAAAPAAFRRVAQHLEGGEPLLTLRSAVSAGEALDGALSSSWWGIGGGQLQDAYGSSEIGFVLANLHGDGAPPRPGVLTSTVPGFEVSLVDEDGDERDEQGILAVRAPRYQASIGYWDLPGAWESRWRGDWFLSGDIFRRDEDGWEFVGRDDDLIVVSGYNVGPSEVEGVLLDHPHVLEAAVVQDQDEQGASIVRAAIVFDHEPVNQEVEELRKMVRERIGRHAYPKIVDVVEELPRTETGKIRRNQIRSGGGKGQRS